MKTKFVTLIIAGFMLSAALHPSTELISNDRKARSDSKGTSLALQLTGNGFVKDQPENHSIRWYQRQGTEKLKGVSLVIHGLNSQPDKMKSIIVALTERGIDCLNLSLRGHGENYPHRDDTESDRARMEAFKTVSYQLWKTETYRAYKQVKKRSDQHKVSLFFIGFSMGGLIGVDLLASNPSVKFDKMVLFAPALKMHARNHIIRVLSPFPKLVIPSFAPKSYLANEGTPMAAYNALFKTLKHFEKKMSRKINVPTVIFIDKQDEFISFSRLNKMVANEKLDRWKIHIVQKDKTANQVKMHHLIIDEASTGKKMWKKIVDTTMEHLSE
jgi:esterase/lipase